MKTRRLSKVAVVNIKFPSHPTKKKCQTQMSHSHLYARKFTNGVTVWRISRVINSNNSSWSVTWAEIPLRRNPNSCRMCVLFMDASLALNWFASSAAAAVPGSLMNSNKYASGLRFFGLLFLYCQYMERGVVCVAESIEQWNMKMLTRYRYGKEVCSWHPLRQQQQSMIARPPSWPILHKVQHRYNYCCNLLLICHDASSVNNK